MTSTPLPANPENPCSLAIIEGVLCRLNRKGRATARYFPVGTAIVEFVVLADGAVLVRELAYGFLPGLSNLYCLDAKLRLLWLAEQPADTELYEAFGEVTEGRVACTTQSGLTVLLDPANGRLQAVAAGVI